MEARESAMVVLAGKSFSEAPMLLQRDEPRALHDYHYRDKRFFMCHTSYWSIGVQQGIEAMEIRGRKYILHRNNGPGAVQVLSG